MKKLIATALLLTLAACTSTTTGGTGATSATGSTSASCALVAKADAEAVVGAVTDTPVGTSAPAVSGVADSASACVYRGANGVVTIALVERSTSRADFDNVAKQVPGAQPISGLGDAAYGASSGTGGAGAATVLVLKGSKYISVAATSTSKSGEALLDASKPLARTAIGKL
jgi:hypothetical protein